MRAASPERSFDFAQDDEAAAFDQLARAASACRRCATLAGSRPVLSRACGPVPADIMLVGEAPGRLGAARSGVPFRGDASGRRLDELLAAAGWSRAAVFITNAVLCNPRDAAGRNRPPSRAEVGACGGWLARQLALVNPRLVVALGAVALRALAAIEPHPLCVADAGAAPLPWHGRWLAAAYHPGARAAIHRPIAQQRADFERLGAWMRTPRQNDAYATNRVP